LPAPIRNLLSNFVIIMIAALSLTASPASSAENPKPDEIRVLFIGNSLTFGGPQWELLEGFAAADPNGPKVKTGHHMRAATSLSWFWDHSWWKSDYKTVQKAIAAEKWTHVVLQPYGDDLRRDNLKILEKYFAAINDAGAQPVIYCTTEGAMENADKKAAESVEKAEKRLLAAAQGHGAWIVPAKRAAYLARKADPVVQIRRPKGGTGNVHPGGLGHYLIAGCFYPVLTGRQVVGSSFIKPGREVEQLDPGEALWLQNVAWKALVSFDQEHGIGKDCKLPDAPPEKLQVDVSKPEDKPRAERITRDIQRRYRYIMKHWKQAKEKAKRRRFDMHRKQKRIRKALELLRQIPRDHPDRELTPELKAIKARILALPEK
jgi:hypothetical protein